MNTPAWRGGGLALAGAFVAAIALFGSQARADTVNFVLNTIECSAPCVPVVVADNLAVHVTINLTDSTHATVTFTPPGSPGSTNIGAPVAINVSGHYQASGTDPLAPTNPCGYGLTACAAAGTGNLGTFTTETGGGTPSSIVITLLAVDGNSWATAASVLTPTTNANLSVYGHGFEAFVEDGNGSQSGHVQYAGYYNPNIGQTGETPLPAALPLFASGLGAFGVLGWRRKRKAQAAA